ncbi:hypothetical protein PVAND_008498 [Polypedilum vanderplanki]|uniref:CHK kinase-like domain-containing protein n=1 Tax=Polypedilum vanderplanki TaxID=319348 RepID=A0A9J6CAT4_POLVA|nr:hypothetical protein PVAND_008498 [Polypedilum vanderplanki]
MNSNCEIEKFFNSDSLNDEFFTDIVEKKLKVSRETFKINLIIVSEATGKNENYASSVYRVKIKIKLNESQEIKNIDVILKVSIENSENDEYKVFPRERFVYEEILSNFEKIWFEKSGEKIQFGPQGLKFTTDPYEIIVLDDLKANGYVMLDRKVGLNVQQTKILLSKIAKFHSLSALRYQKEGILNELLNRSSAPMDVNSDYGKSFVRMFLELIKALERFGDCEIYVEKFKKFDTTTVFNSMNDDSPLKCSFRVLNHGDFWINNIMYKFVENEAVDVLLVDFQLCVWGSPWIDLFNILLTSIHDDFRTKYFDEFIEFYHQELSKALEIIGYEKHIPTLQEIYDDMMEKSLLAAMVPSYLMYIKFDGKDSVRLSETMSETDNEKLSQLYEEIYKCENTMKSIKLLLPFLNERGFLEFKKS